MTVIEQLPGHFPPEDGTSWSEYWKRQGHAWRTEPEIDEKRQGELAKQQAIPSDIHQGIYPFKNTKLSRADIEWLLANHENGCGLVIHNDESQQRRAGLDLRGADLRQVNLSGLPLTQIRGGLNQEERLCISNQEAEAAAVHLEGADLSKAHLERADLYGAYLKGATFYRTRMEECYLKKAHLEQASLYRAHLERAGVMDAHVEDADLREAHLEGSNLKGTRLEGAILDEAFLDSATNLRNTVLGTKGSRYASLADVRWGGVNLAVVNWVQIKMLGDEQRARQSTTSDGKKKDRLTRLAEYQTAVRASRQLSAVLRAQGLQEEADYFAYRAQILCRRILWWQHKLPAFAFAWFLYLISGYGYRPVRSFAVYLLIILVFTMIYTLLGTASHNLHLSWYEGLVISLTAFHGRGFFADQFKPGDIQAFVAAIEAVVGLIIEISFIATFTQRFFGK